MNPYRVLDLPPTATRAEIRSAYRGLARRWHPDRFMEGPERDWANEKMAEINAAYAACMRGNSAETLRDSESESRALRRIEEMIDGGEYAGARRMLMNLKSRRAEWNYLFGALLLRTSETHKAQIYLSVAVHQQPDNAKYVRALKEARTANEKKRLTDGLKRHFSR